jgi:predicted nucleotidyltransferase
MDVRKRTAWVEALRDEFQRDPRVKAVWLGGSLGRGGGDVYSDVDFYVAVEAADFEPFFAEVPARLQAMQPLLHHTDFAFRRQSPTERVWFLWFEGWPVQWKLDFHVHTTDSARGADPDQRRELMYGEWHVYYDPEQLLALLPPVESPGEAAFRAHVQETVDNLAWNFALASVYVLRGDFWQASRWLQTLHERILYLLAIDADPGMTGDAYPRRFVKVIAPQELAELNGAVYDRDPQSMARAGLQLLRLFAKAAQRLCARVEAVYPERYLEAVTEAYEGMVVKKAGDR